MVAHGKLVRHAHGTMQLHRLLAHQPRRLAELVFGCRHGSGARRQVQPQAGAGCTQQCTALLDRDVHVHHPVLQHLETRQRLAELAARAQVLARLRQQALHGAQGIRANRQRGAIQRPGQRSACLPGRAEAIDSLHAHAVQHQIRGGPAIHGHPGADGQPRSTHRQREQAVARTLAGAHQQQVGHGRVEDAGLHAVQDNSAGLRLCPRTCGFTRKAGRGLEMGQRQAQLTRRQVG